MMRYEWKKLFGSRLNVTVMLIGYLVIGVCIFNFIKNHTYYDERTGDYVSGTEAFRLDQERAKAQTDVISEEYITALIRDIQGCGMDLESDRGYREVILPRLDLFYFTAGNYTDMRANHTDRNALMELDLTDGAQFYEQRMKKITAYLNCDFSYGNYTAAEKAFWLRKAQGIEVPFCWGSKDNMDVVWDTVALCFFLVFVVVICASSVFSAEYESGAASLLLTTKYGKNRLIASKVAVTVLFVLGYLSVGNGMAVGIYGLLLGFQGADLPVQLWKSVIPYDLTVGQACALTFVFDLLIGITVALVLLCCSAMLRSSLATLAIGVALIIAPAFLPMSKESRLWNHINMLFPVRMMNVEDVLGTYMSYTLGGHVVSCLSMMVIVYGVISVAALLLVRRGFVKRR